jgi:hypothetical protein
MIRTRVEIMSSETQRATLMCSGCRQLTTHRFIYAGRLLTHTECENCGHVVHPENQGDLPHEYAVDLRQRLRTKPQRMARRAAQHPLRFLANLPRAIVRQPIKLANELRTIRKEKHDKGDR